MIGLPVSCNMMINQYRKLTTPKASIFLNEDKYFNASDYKRRLRRERKRARRQVIVEPYVPPSSRSRSYRRGQAAARKIKTKEQESVAKQKIVTEIFKIVRTNDEEWRSSEIVRDGITVTILKEIAFEKLSCQDEYTWKLVCKKEERSMYVRKQNGTILWGHDGTERYENDIIICELEKDWDCPCGCGNHGPNGGCPCGCASLKDHNKKRRFEVRKKKSDNGVVCRMMKKMKQNVLYSQMEMKQIFKHIRASWEPSNMCGHLNGRDTAGRYGKILVKYENKYKIHSDFH